MTNVIEFKNKDQLALEKANDELDEALSEKHFLSGEPIIDGAKLKRVIVAQANVTRLKKILYERKII